MRTIFILALLAATPLTLQAEESLTAQCLEEYKQGHLEKALYYCHGSASHPEAQLILGKIYSLEGMGSPEMKKAYEYFTAAANQNQPDAQFLMALCYQNGLGVQQNTASAVYWYQQAQSNGLKGPSLDPTRTRQSQTLSPEFISNVNDLINAAEKGLAEAEYQLGLAYSFGKGSTADDGKAWSWLNKAAHQNHQGAQSYLAWMSMLGLGKPEDKTQAIHWFILANQENTSTPNANDVIDELLSNPHSSSYHDRSADAEYLQGVELIESRFNEQDVKDGLTLLEKASDEKYAPAQFYLAKLYHEGHLVSKDLKMAAKLYTEAAYNGHPEAQYTLGWMYFYGEGVPQNQEEAFLWFSEANEHEKKATDAIQFLQSQRNVVELGNHPAKTSFKEKVRQASNYVKTLITRR